MIMKRHSFTQIAFISLLIQSIHLILPAQTPGADQQHTIVIKQWTLPGEKDGTPFLVEYDGKLLHENEMGMSDLDNLKFEAGSVVKVVLPPGPMPEENNWLRETLFMHSAIDDGASLVFYQGEVKLNYHTLQFRNLRLGAFSKEKKWRGGWNTDTATYLLDGKKYHDGPSTAAELMKLPTDGLLILVLFSSGDDGHDSRMMMTDKSEMDRCVESLKSKKVKFLPVGGCGYNGWPVPIYPDR